MLTAFLRDYSMKREHYVNTTEYLMHIKKMLDAKVQAYTDL